MAGSYYLMSACQTADEFVAAFRRYAEKSMLFVPTATPLPQGARARIAITLADGSVMIEGDAEVVGSTPRAVGLHARPGMSVRFIELDDTSRQVIDQLVRARLMSRPVPLPTHLRPRPRAGTVPEPSPELQAEHRARATSTVTGMAPIANVNAEALPAECTLVEVPPDPKDLEARFDYSAPAPRDADVELEPAVPKSILPSVAPRPMTIKGPGLGKMPGLATPALGIGALARAGITTTSPIETPAAEPAADPSTEISIDEVSAESIEDVDAPAMPEVLVAPSPPKLPATPRGRQSMSKTMMGVAPIVLKPPGPTSAQTPAVAPPVVKSETATSPGEAPAEVFAPWWPEGEPHPDHAETQPMEPLFGVEPAPAAPSALGPWPGDAAKLPPPPHDLAHAPTELSRPASEAPTLEPAFPAPPTFAQPFPDPGPPPVFEENTDLVEKKKRPNRVMIASFGGALLVAVILVVIATGGGKKSDATATADASGTATPAPTPAAVVIDAAPAPVAVASIDAAAAAITPPTPPAPIPNGACKASFTSTPPGADLAIAGKPAGTTPATLALPCGASTATFKRARYQPKDVAFTPTSDGVTVAAKLERPSFTVKITSTPAGATVSIAGKVVGKTPLTTKAAGFEASTVSFKKDGYTPATAKLYAKANGAVVAVKLKKGGAAAPKPSPHHR